MFDRPLRVRWVVGSIHNGDHMEILFCSTKFSTTSITKDVVCAILPVHIKYPLLLIERGNPCSRFLLSIF